MKYDNKKCKLIIDSSGPTKYLYSVLLLSGHQFDIMCWLFNATMKTV